jgi:hypothetical protein
MELKLIGHVTVEYWSEWGSGAGEQSGALAGVAWG